MSEVELEGYTSRAGIRVASGVFVADGARDSDGLPVTLTFSTPAASRRIDARLRREHQLLSDLPEGVARRAVALETSAARTTVLVLERVDDLRPLTELVGQLTVADFVPLALRICEAVALVHARGVVHGRLSPANILVDSDRRRVLLQGFTFATPLDSVDADAPAHDEVSAAELAPAQLRYFAPEQTGRMARAVDLRSDLYTLGVTFYELLAGQPAFVGEEPRALLHALLARLPTALHERDPAIPTRLSRVVARLMAKNKGERYADAQQLVEALTLVTADADRPAPRVVSARLGELVLPDATRGRARALGRLHAEFERARRGRPRLVALFGVRGAGKSAIARSLAPLAEANGGLFIEGKFDALNTSGAFTVVLETVAEIARHAQRLPAEERARLRVALFENLGPLIDALASALPDARALLGEHTPTPRAEGSREGRRKRELALVRFLREFAKPTRPVVLFLDDLQWADAATRRMVQLIVSTLTSPGIMIVCAARAPDEDAPPGPFQDLLETLTRRELPVSRIELGPLSPAELRDYVAASVAAEPGQLAPLSEWLQARSGGNPLELRALLGELHARGHLFFEADNSRWGWRPPPLDDARWTAEEITARALAELPQTTREALSVAACLGRRFHLTTLRAALALDDAALDDALADAEAAGLLLREPLDSPTSRAAYAGFCHNVARDAAYALTPEPSRPARHLEIGHRLLADARARQLEGKLLVDIVGHLNRGQTLIHAAIEREELAALNLDAARHAKTASAHEIAIELLNAGLVALQANPADTNEVDAASAEWPIWAPELSFALTMELAESHHAIGHLPRAEELTRELIRQDVSRMHIARACALRTHVLASLGRSEDAISAAVQGMEELGEHLPVAGRELEETSRDEIDEVRYFIESRDRRVLLGRPIARDERHRITIETLGNLVPAASGTHEHLFNLCAARGVLLGIRRGYNEQTPFAYTLFGFILALKFGEYKTGYSIGELGHELNARLGAVVNKARLPFALALQAGFSNPPARAIELLSDSIRAALESDDSMYLGFASSNRLAHIFASGAPLREVDAAADESLRLMRRTGMSSSQAAQRLLRWHVAKLRGFAPDGAELLRDDDIPELLTRVRSTFVNGIYLLTRLLFAVLQRDKPTLDELLEASDRFNWTDGWFWRTERAFYAGMACGILAAADPDRVELLTRLEEFRDDYARWTEAYPETHISRLELLTAEHARARGDLTAALQHYERAIAASRRGGNPIHQAIAYERAAMFHRKHEARALAYLYFVGAADAYRTWGADALADRLEPELERLGDAAGLTSLVTRARGQTAGEPTSHASADLQSLHQAARTLRGEADPARLLAELLRIAVRDAGAERGVLLRERDKNLFVSSLPAARGDGKENEEDDDVSDDVDNDVDNDELAAALLGVIEPMAREHDPLVRDDATQDAALARASYIQTRRPRSLLCVQLAHRGRRVGMLYLENTVAAGVFTPARVQFVELLGAQLAVALLAVS